MRKCLRYILYSVILIIITLVILICLFVTTNAGLRTGVSIAKYFIPGELAYTKINGSLIGPLEVKGLNYQNKDMRIHVMRIYLKGSLLSLVFRDLNLKTLTIQNVNYYQYTHENAQKTKEKTQPSKPSQQAFEWKGLPIKINIAQANINNIFIHNNKETTQFNQLAFSIHTSRQKVSINKLNVKTPNYQARLNGNILAKTPFTTALTAELSGQLNQEQLTDLHLNIKGDVKKLAITAQSKKPFISTANIQLLNLNDHPSINAHANWQNLIWIVDGVSSLKMEQGQASIQGPLNNYQFSASTDLSGSKIPAGNWNIHGKGTDHSLNIQQLTSKILDGTVYANANINWSSQLNWQANIDGRHINPGVKWKHWKADLNFNTQLTGNISKEKQLTTRAVISQLNGNLHQYHLTGKADIELNHQALIIHTLTAKLGKNQINASGHLNQQWQMQWQAKFPDLHAIWETGGGSFTSQGKITGNRAHPKMSAQAEGSKINLPWFSLDSLITNTQIGAQPTAPANLQLELHNLHYKHYLAKNIQIISKGIISKQKITAKYTASNLTVNTQLNGGLKNNSWQGLLQTIKINTKDFQNWQLQQASNLQLSPQKISLDNACIVSGSQKICGQAFWKANTLLSAKLISSGLNLSMLNPLFPSHLKINAPIHFNLQIHSNKNGKQSGSSKISIPSGKINYTYQKTTQTLKINPSNLAIDLSPQGITGKFNIAADPEQTITGNITLPGFILLKGLPNNQKIEGKLALNAPDLTWLASVVGPLEKTKGSINGSLLLSGNLNSPEINGELHLKNASTTIPRFGLSPHDINLTAIFKPEQKLAYNGTLISGKGKLGIRGSTELNSLFNTQLEVKGYNVLGINNQEYKIYLSPDLNIQFNKPKLMISGSLNIPNADITPKTFSGTTTLPDNIIYIETHKKDSPPLATYLNVNLSLKNVDFAYQGLKAQIEGQLKINDAPNTVMSATGSLHTVKGGYKAYSQNLTIRKGRIFYNGGPIGNPGLDISAIRQIQTVFGSSGIQQTLTVGVNVTGSIKYPKLTLFSEPVSLSQANTLSYIIFGRGTDTASGGDGQILLAAASSLGLEDNSLTKSIQSTFGLSELGFESDEVMNQEGGLESNTSLVIGKQITPKLSIKYSAGLLVPVNVLRMMYQLSRHWSAQTNASTYDSGADLFYTINTD